MNTKNNRFGALAARKDALVNGFTVTLLVALSMQLVPKGTVEVPVVVQAPAASIQTTADLTAEEISAQFQAIM